METSSAALESRSSMDLTGNSHASCTKERGDHLQALCDDLATMSISDTSTVLSKSRKTLRSELQRKKKQILRN